MSTEDLAKGLKAIEDETVRNKVAEGDLVAAGELDLTEEEAALLKSAAEDPEYPEVAGFAFDSYMKIEGIRFTIPRKIEETSTDSESLSLNFSKVEWQYEIKD